MTRHMKAHYIGIILMYFLGRGSIRSASYGQFQVFFPKTRIFEASLFVDCQSSLLTLKTGATDDGKALGGSKVMAA